MNTADITEDLVFVRDNVLTLARRFESNPTLFFNESDFQSELFTQLLVKYSNEGRITKTRVWGTDKPKPIKAVYSRRLHSELLLPEGRIDLAILDLDNVVFAVNSKGRFGYIQLTSGNHIFIEIKSSRTIRSCVTSRGKWLRSLIADIEKLSHYNHHCFLVCFDFNRYLDKNSISKLRQSVAANLELFYFTNKQADNYLVDV
jgi:hypothetical protein